MSFVLDTNIVVTAFRSYYAFDLVPSFWERLLDQAAQGYVLSIDRVEDELYRGQVDGEPDRLAEWVQAHSAEMFAATSDQDVLASYAALMQWASEQSYLPAAVATFAAADNADAWLVAFAMARQHTVVTLETPAPARVRTVKIPDACNAMGVEFVDTFEMLRRLGVRLS